jgi:broad specificity phosphatase PhoE
VLGHGKGVEKRVNHTQQVKDLVQQIERQDLRNFVVVGHSMVARSLRGWPTRFLIESGA